MKQFGLAGVGCSDGGDLELCGAIRDDGDGAWVDGWYKGCEGKGIVDSIGYSEPQDL